MYSSTVKLSKQNLSTCTVQQSNDLSLLLFMSPVSMCFKLIPLWIISLCSVVIMSALFHFKCLQLAVFKIEPLEWSMILHMNAHTLVHIWAQSHSKLMTNPELDADKIVLNQIPHSLHCSFNMRYNNNNNHNNQYNVSPIISTHIVSFRWGTQKLAVFSSRSSQL